MSCEKCGKPEINNARYCEPHLMQYCLDAIHGQLVELNNKQDTKFMILSDKLDTMIDQLRKIKRYTSVNLG